MEAEERDGIDLLSEYSEMMLEEFIEGKMGGYPVWFKQREGGMDIYTPDPNCFGMILNGPSYMVKIEVPAVGQRLELVGKLSVQGRDMYRMEVIQFKEVAIDVRPVE